MRTKYVQSSIGNSYHEVYEALCTGRKVLFSGTPCQVRGLKNYLQAKNAGSVDLITVDFKCHGVPSPRLFKDFVSSLKSRYNFDVMNVTFREKDNGWRRQVIKVYFKNKRVWKKPSLNYFYYYFFLKNYSLKDSCYKCSEYCSHMSDLTLADDWTSDAVKNENGTSLIFTNTYKGEEILKAINSQISLSQACIPNIAIYSHKGYSYQRKKKMVGCVPKRF